MNGRSAVERVRRVGVAQPARASVSGNSGPVAGGSDDLQHAGTFQRLSRTGSVADGQSDREGQFEYDRLNDVLVPRGESGELRKSLCQ